MFRFRSRRSQEAADALAAAQEALDRLAQSTEKLNAAGKRAGEALAGLADATARAEARLADVHDADPPAERSEPAAAPDDQQQR